MKKINNIIDMIQIIVLLGAFVGVFVAMAPAKIFITYVAVLASAAAGSGIIRGAINDR